jgi:hypothetical protein
MEPNALVDVVRFSHVLAVAVGLGAAFLADFHSLRRLGRPVDDDLLVTLHSCHQLVWAALIAMWGTGLGLVYIRTGFHFADFSPKLCSKLVTVTALTLNALWIGRFVIPVIENQRDSSIMWLPLRKKLSLAVAAAISTTSWLLALAMGISKVLAQSDWLTFVVTLPVAYAVCIGTALAVMYLLHLGGHIGSQRPRLILAEQSAGAGRPGVPAAEKTAPRTGSVEDAGHVQGELSQRIRGLSRQARPAPQVP